MVEKQNKKIYFNRDDREGRFLLRRIDEHSNMPQVTRLPINHDTLISVFDFFYFDFWTILSSLFVYLITCFFGPLLSVYESTLNCICNVSLGPHFAVNKNTPHV